MSKGRIKDIVPETEGPEINIRIIKKWIPHNKREGLCYLLVDAYGDAIEAVTNSSNQQYYDSILQVQSSYAISKYISAEPRKQMAVVPHKASIRIGKMMIYSETDRRRKHPHILLQLYSIRVLATTHIKVQTISRLNNIEITLWTNKVNDIDQHHDVGKIIAVTSMLVTTYNDIQLESTSATTVYIDPPLPDLEEYKKRFKDIPHTSAITNQKSITTLAELLSRTAEHNIQIKGTCEARITNIDLDHSWYYVRCNKCDQPAYPARTNRFFHQCADHGEEFGIKYMYCLNAHIADESSNTKAVFFDEAMTEMLNTTCRDMVLKKGYTNPRTIPDDISSLRDIPHLLQLTVKNKNIVYVNSAQKQTTITPTTPNPKATTPRYELQQTPEKGESSKRLKT